MQDDPGQQELLRGFEAARGAPVEDPLVVQQALQDCVARAQQAWPGLTLSATAFARVLGERAEPGEDAVDYLARVHAGDLYLVSGCLLANPEALRLLDAQFITRLAREQRNGGLAAYLDDAQQMLRVRLLVAHGDEPPRLAGYRGRGPLVAWLRLTLTRLALNARESALREVPSDQELIEESTLSVDPELAFLRRHHRAAIAAAMTDAFEAVSPDERTILRMHFLDGLSADQVGRLFDVSGRTIQRRIADARRNILTRTRALLRAQLRVQPSQLDTLMRLCDSDLELSLARLLDHQGPR